MNASQSPQSPIAHARALFVSEGLPFPPLSPEIEARILEIEDHMFATESLNTRPYDVYGCAEALINAGTDKNFALLGFDGHGVNSWAVHYYLVQPRLALFLQLPWGGIYMDQDAGRRAIEKAFQWAASSQERIAAAVGSGELQDRRLIVVSSAFGGSAWTLASSSDETASLDWTAIEGAPDELDEALSALFGETQVSGTA